MSWRVRVRYFGELFDAPVYEEAEHAAVPAGRSCLYRGCVIEEDDQGFLILDWFSIEIGNIGGTAVIPESPWQPRLLPRIGAGSSGSSG